MRRLRLYSLSTAALLLALAAGSSSVQAQAGSAPQAQQPAAEAPLQNLDRQGRLSRLHQSLKRERDAARAKGIASQIRSEWADSGSPTINLLMGSASNAAEKQQNAAALDFLDRVTILEPDYAEAWFRRAMVHYAMNDSRKAMADVQQALTVDPQRFDVLSMLATALEANDREQLAMDALMRYLEIYPADRDVQKRVLELSEKLDGSRS